MKFVKLQDSKLIYRNLLHFYANSEISEREIKKTILFIIELKITKYLRINLPMEVNLPMYSENYKTLMKDTEDDTKRWKDILGSCTGRTDIVKMTILSKAI